jgi:penicillin-binding protein 1A
MVGMMRGVVTGGTATAANVLPHPVAGKTGTVNDHTDVWFIGYTPTYVTGVWMGYPGKKKPLGNDMTGGKGALPMFVEFMKTFLKDKEKEEFPKAPEMPEDMRELFRQRQRELAAERAELAAQAKTDDDTELPPGTTEPKLEQVTMPPPPKADTDEQPKAPAKPEAATPKIEAPPPATTRPRETEPAKKKGKKGDGEP